MTQLTYPQLVRELFPRLTGGVRWGLERTEALLEAVGSPHRTYRVVHIGGTNGKGSVAATVASVLQHSGQRTGLYTSPHLCTFRERIQVGGTPLSEEEILSSARRLWPLVQESGATFFEATTAIAFLALAEAGVESAVVEVGLGGRLDATNVVTPDVVALTNVALEHTELLGTDRVAIAREKAGIIKAGAPVVTAESDPTILKVFHARTLEVGATLHVLEPDEPSGVAWDRFGTRFRLRTAEWGQLELHTPLIGGHQAANAALAVRALELLPVAARPDRQALLAGLAGVRWPGRLQLAASGGATLLFDAAHNPAGVSALTAALERLDLPRPIVLLAGFLGDKDWSGMLQRLRAAVDAVVLTIPPTAPEHRRWNPSAAADATDPAVIVQPDFTAALRRALALATLVQPAGTVLVAGSLHTVGDALLALGLPPADPVLPLLGTRAAGCAGSGATLPAGAIEV